MDKEIRCLYDECELRAEPETRSIEGYGIVFNRMSQDLGGFREIILPEAIQGVLEKSDILDLLNHNIDRGVLARSINGKGSLKLEVRENGVYYSYKAPKTQLGNEVIEGIERGDIRGASFGFTVAPKGDKIEKLDDGTFLRTIRQFDRIFEISQVYREAYQDTTVAVRNLEEFKTTLETEPPNIDGGDSPADPLDGKTRPRLTNKELALIARNNYFKNI